MQYAEQKRIEDKMHEIDIVTAAWKKQTQFLSEFLFTNLSEPSIAWLPKHQNAITLSMLERQRSKVMLINFFKLLIANNSQRQICIDREPYITTGARR